MNELPVGSGTKVTLNFSLELEDGSEVDSNFGHDPVSFVVGDGSLLPGFEEAMFGLVAGEKKTFNIPPEKGFGQRNPANLQRIPRKDFSDVDELQEGMIFSFADSKGHERPGVVAEWDNDKVIVDFNHPLAGHEITFTVKVFDVTPEVTH